MEWNTWIEAWPDWQDTGKRVEIEFEDGKIVTGMLCVDDFFPDGEGGEVPIFIVIDESNKKHNFEDNKRWRFA